MASITSLPEGSSSSRLRIVIFRICLEDLPTRLNRDVQHPADLAFSVSPSQLREVQEY